MVKILQELGKDRRIVALGKKYPYIQIQYMLYGKWVKLINIINCRNINRCNFLIINYSFILDKETGRYPLPGAQDIDYHLRTYYYIILNEQVLDFLNAMDIGWRLGGNDGQKRTRYEMAGQGRPISYLHK